MEIINQEGSGNEIGTPWGYGGIYEAQHEVSMGIRKGYSQENRHAKARHNVYMCLCVGDG